MKVRVVKRFNRMAPGTVVDATDAEAKSWLAHGLVVVVDDGEKSVTSPVDKMIRKYRKKKA